MKFLPVTEVTQIGIAGASHLYNRTFDEKYATLYGYTEEEIVVNFPEFLAEMTRCQRTSLTTILKDLKEMYSIVSVGT